MKKLSKNFQQRRRTVEAMSGGCSMFGSCSCSAVMDCGCGSDTSATSGKFNTQGKYYFNSFRDADF